MQRCVICLSEEYQNDLFRPCLCKSYIHHVCLREWRHKGQNLRAYTHCPTCAYKYRVVTVDIGKNYHSIREYYFNVAKFWVVLFFGLISMIGVYAGVSYLCDTTRKNVPVVVKYMLSSVIHGIPTTDEITKWRNDFYKDDVRVWPYYLLLGVLCTSITLLIGANVFGLNDTEYEQLPPHRRRSTGRCDRCCDNCDVYCDCCGQDCCSASSCNCNCGGNCDCKGGDGEAIAIGAIVIILFIVVIVVLSAVWVVVGFVVKRMANLHDAYSARLYAYSQERSGETR
eukprot:PhF_6_TR8788/c0_g1_i5/m.13940